MSSFEDILAREGRLVYRTRGASMEPMLRQDRDLVIIRAADSRLRKYDVAFYRRGSDYILHRVIKVKEDSYLIRGDNTFSLEDVPDNAVIGVLTGFQRKGKEHSTDDRSYRRYVRFWNAVYPLRYAWRRFRRFGAKTARKLGILPSVKKTHK